MAAEPKQIAWDRARQPVAQGTLSRCDDAGALSCLGGLSNAGKLLFGISGAGSNGVINVSNVTTLGGTFAANLLGGYTPVVGQTFDVMNFANGYSGTFANSVYTVNGVTFDGVDQANQFDRTVASVAAVPEHSAWMTMLIGMGLMDAMVARRRRQGLAPTGT